MTDPTARQLRRHADFLRKEGIPEQVIAALTGTDGSGNPERDAYAKYLDQMGWSPDGPLYNRIVTEDRPDALEAQDTIVICQSCGVMLNRFSQPDGTQSWAHSKTWNRYDHEPVPVEVPTPPPYERDMVCDFCGIEQNVIWSFIGERVEQIAGNIGNDFGRDWAACTGCEPLVDAGDVAGLAQRAIRHGYFARDVKNDPRTRRIMLSQFMDLHGKFIATIHTKKYVGPPVLGARLNPRGLHKIQAGLRRWWGNPALFDRLIKPGFGYGIPGALAGHEDTFKVSYGNDGPPLPREVFDAHAHHLDVGTQAAQLFYVSEKFTRYATVAGLELKNISLRRDQLPSAHGLVFYETPVGEVPRPYGSAGIRALGWTLVPGGIWVNIYIQAEEGDPTLTDIADYRAEWGQLVCPNLGSGIPFLDNWGEITGDFIKQGQFLLTLLSTFYLLRQPGVAETSTVNIDKKIARSIQRSTGRKPSEITLIDLRKKPRTPRKEGEVKHWELKYARRTPGHWRNQWYPKQGTHEPKWIDEYVSRGDLPWRPDDPPKPTVKVLR